MVRVLIVAPYAAVRAGLNVLLADAAGCEVVGEVSGSAELEELLAAARPDIVLLDANDSEAGRVLDLLAGSEAGLVVLSDNPDDLQMLAARDLPGWAYLRKDADGAEIANAVAAAASGLIVLDRALAPLLSASVLAGGRDGPDGGRDSLAAGPPAPGQGLTAREREVLQLMAEGLPNKIIATRLRISQHTVKFHVASILAKLNATSRTEAVTVGARQGYITF